MKNYICMIGQFGVGKDHLAAQVNATVISMAEPLYRMAMYYFGTSEKNVPGIREFLQKTGQWGRGTVSAQYPLTPERGLFSQFWREHGESILPGLGVNWSDYGVMDTIWIDAANARAPYLPLSSVRAITNIRFENELDAFYSRGWVPFYVTCRPETLERRRRAQGTYSAAASGDISEAMADEFEDCFRRNKPLPFEMPIVWNDDGPVPERAISVDEFRSQVTQ